MTNGPRGARGRRADLRRVPGRYEVKPLDDDREWHFYWHAFLGDNRINGGVARNYEDGMREATRAIALARHDLLRDEYYWDVEYGDWVRKGDLPPVS